MALPSFLFSFSFKHKIWQTALDESNGKMTLEVRNEAVQEIEFYLLDFQNRTLSDSFRVPQADWWTTTLKLTYPYLLLEQYGDPQNPTDKGLLIFHIKDQAIFSQVPGFQFECFDGLDVLGYDLQDTNTRKSVTLEERLISTDGTKDRLKNPVYFHPGTQSHDMVMEYLQLDEKNIGCEYFEEGSSIIISYYVRLGTKFERKLLVIHNEEEIYHAVVDEQVDGFASGGFFLYERIVVFIENGYKINAIEL